MIVQAQNSNLTGILFVTIFEKTEIITARVYLVSCNLYSISNYTLITE